MAISKSYYTEGKRNISAARSRELHISFNLKYHFLIMMLFQIFTFTLIFEAIKIMITCRLPLVILQLVLLSVSVDISRGPHHAHLNSELHKFVILLL